MGEEHGNIRYNRYGLGILNVGYTRGNDERETVNVGLTMLYVMDTEYEKWNMKYGIWNGEIKRGK